MAKSEKAHNVQNVQTGPDAVSAAVRNARIPVALNVMLAGGHIVMAVYFFFLLPAYLLPRSPWWGLTLFCLVLLSPQYWSVIHEAIHGVFARSQKLNVIAGRVLGIFFLTPFRIIRFGHLAHHAYSRTSFDEAEVYDPEKTPRWKARLRYYYTLLFGLYGMELASNVLIMLPRKYSGQIAYNVFEASRKDVPDTGAQARKTITEGWNLWSVRLDAAFILLISGVSLYLYGAAWWMVVLAIIGRGILVSMLDNAPHYGTPLGSREYAYDMHLPRWAAQMLLNFNYHYVHHKFPRLPWSHLPGVFKAENGRFEGGYVSRIAAQLQGPIARSDIPKRP